MRNNKQLLADTYLALLAIPVNDRFRTKHQRLYATVLDTLAYELGEEAETVQRIFERMTVEDGK